MVNTDLNSSSSSTGSNASSPSTTVSTGSFYGKKSTFPKLQVKISKLSASDIEYYLGMPPSETEIECKSKFLRTRRKVLQVVGSDATRHNIKPLSARKHKIVSSGNGKVKQKGKDELMDNSEEECLNVRRNPQRKSTSLVPKNKYMGLDSECSDDEEESEDTCKVQNSTRKRRSAQASEEDCSDFEEEFEDIIEVGSGPRKIRSAQTSEENQRGIPLGYQVRRNPSRKAVEAYKDRIAKAKKETEDLNRRGIPLGYQVRRNPGRKAVEAYKDRIAKAKKETEDLESFDFYSNFSSDDEDDWSKKPKKPTVQKKDSLIVPQPEFSDYEKAAQEKLALHQEFLKSLNIHSL